VASVCGQWRTFEYEVRMRRADGKYRWVLHRKVAMRDRHGEHR